MIDLTVLLLMILIYIFSNPLDVMIFRITLIVAVYIVIMFI
jgi:hypothetical protein